MRAYCGVLVCAGVVAQLITASVAQAANTSIPARPVTDVVTVQPIDVCDATGNSCASLANLATYEDAANAVWNQAGLGFAFLPAVQFDVPTAAPDFLHPTITIASGFPSGTPTDLAHQLMYGPGHGQSSNPTTLNLWLVDTLARSDHVGVYGTGFIGGNGITLPTLPNPDTGGLPNLDTLAHELGHNLGLPHVDGTSLDSPLNMLRSVGRNVATNTCQINPNTCSPLSTAKDNLLSSQDTTARNPLFTVNLAQVTATVDHTPGVCVQGSKLCDINFNFASSTTTQSLLAIKVRSLVANSIIDGTVISGSGMTVTGAGFTGTKTTSALSPTGAFVAYNFASGVFTEGDSFNLNFDYSTCGGTCFGWPPFSVEFDFTSGFTSAALFDGSGFADSQLPGSLLQYPFSQGLGFIGTPTYGLGMTVPVVACTDVEGSQTTGAESPCTFSAVPEPPAVGMFITALAMLGAILCCTKLRDCI